MIPKDKNGYVVSFAPNNINNIINFLDEYGVVVISDIIDNKEIEETIEGIWQHDELISRGVKRDDKDTWGRNWPQDGLIERKGWISSYDDMKCLQSWKNRFNKNIINIFENIWKNAKGENVDLRVKLDRYGVMRPIINSKWKTDEGWLHTDQNPVTEKDLIKFQGILTLSNSNENNGGFICIPKFHKEWINYCETNRPDKDVCPFTNNNDERAEKITAKAGSLIIWDSRLPHCNYPNNSLVDFRYVQYLTYHPVEYESLKRQRIRKEDANIIYNILAQQGYLMSEKEIQLIGGYNII